MMDAEPAAGPLDDGPRALGLLVSRLHVRGGIGAVSAACHQDVPDVDGAVLTVVAAHAGRIILSDSGPGGDQLEDLHALLGEGPSIDAARTGEPVTVVDLDHPQAHASWPRFARQAPARGFRAVFAFPVLLRRRPIGALSLYRAAAGALSAADHRLADRYARAVAVLLLEDRHVTDAGKVTGLPIHAGEVQQAVGVVMEYADVDADTAMHRLRAYAHASERPMRDVVAEVRARRLPFDPMAPT